MKRIVQHLQHILIHFLEQCFKKEIDHYWFQRMEMSILLIARDKFFIILCNITEQEKLIWKVKVIGLIENFHFEIYI